MERVFTQNIDGLDFHTGISPAHVTAVHGSIAQVRCEGCEAAMPFQAFCDQVRSNIKDIYNIDPTAPKESTPISCPKCSKPLVKPSTVLFGSSLPEEKLTAIAACSWCFLFCACVYYCLKSLFHRSWVRFFDKLGELETTNLLIVAGTSLVVSPANCVVQYVPSDCLRLIVNREPVGQDLGLRYGPDAGRDVWPGEKSCDEVFLDLIKLLGWQSKVVKIKHLLPEGNQDLVKDLE